MTSKILRSGKVAVAPDTHETVKNNAPADKAAVTVATATPTSPAAPIDTRAIAPTDAPAMPVVIAPAPIASQPTLADIHQSILHSSAELCAKIDNLTAEVTSVKAKVHDLENAVSFNAEKVLKLEKNDLPNIKIALEKQICDLQEKMMEMEIYQRRSNLLFYGISEKQNEDVYAVLRSTFVQLLNDPGPDATNIAIANCHRLPRRAIAATDSGQPPKAIIAKFVYMGDRNKILAAYEGRNRRDQRSELPSRLTVRTDLPPTLKYERGKLAKVAYDLRKNKGVSTKILVKKGNVFLQWKEKNSTSWKDYKE